ncbi:MAG TPA: hypothetical protein VIK38_05455, partial [Coriobacteriia bacterium]
PPTATTMSDGLIAMFFSETCAVFGAGPVLPEGVVEEEGAAEQPPRNTSETSAIAISVGRKCRMA